jgi:hypothetical protein
MAPFAPTCTVRLSFLMAVDDDLDRVAGRDLAVLEKRAESKLRAAE